MPEITEILGKVAQRVELTADEYDFLRRQQELIDDAIETENGRQRGLSSEAFRHRANGAGLAIVVGHTKNSPGAYGRSPISQSEYFWNADLASMLKSACDRRGLESRIFFRDGIGISGAYNQVRLWGAACVVELHFNAFNSTAHGTETLYDADKNAGSASWAERLQAAMLSALGLHNRGLKERDPGDRGYASVSALNIPSALIEPFFGDNGGDAQVANANKGELAEAVAEAASAQVSTV